MEYVLLLLIVLFISIFFLSYYFIKYKNLIKKLHENPTYETQLILADLMRSGSLLRVERVAPEHIFLRRP